MDGELICNYKLCRQKLFGTAWVTACSHIFCNEHGVREFSKKFLCPACNTSLSGEKEINRIQLCPSDQFRAMILAGQKPDVILDICSRAMSFWNYQMQQELTYQEYMNLKLKDKLKHSETTYEEKQSRLVNENSTITKEKESQMAKHHELVESFNEKNRKHQKLQSMYEALRRKFISSSMLLDQKNKCTLTKEDSSNIQGLELFGIDTATSILGAPTHLPDKNPADLETEFQLDFDQSFNITEAPVFQLNTKHN